MTCRKRFEEHMNSNIRVLMRGDETLNLDKDPVSLLTPCRLDVVVKYLYARSIIGGVRSKFIERLYLNHIRTINGFVETDDTNKVGSQEFLESFNKLISEPNTLDPANKFVIPINCKGKILDGAHRLALALARGIKCIDTITISAPNHIYNVDFFRFGHLTEVEIDLLVHEYCKLQSKTKGVLIWPAAKSTEIDPISALKQFGTIVHTKEIALNFEALVQLVRVVYKNEPWLGTAEDDYQGSRNKARWCSKDGANLTFVIFEPHEGTDIISTKETLRNYYNLGKHSLHIGDTCDETIELCQVLLNNNSVHWLESSSGVEFPRFQNNLSLLQNEITKRGLEKDDFIILGASLAAFGIREAYDLDYVNSTLKNLLVDCKKIELDVEKLNWTGQCLSDLLSDPNHHYFYGGLKFLSVENVYRLKSRRRRDQDLEDLRILQVLKNRQKYRASAAVTFRKLASFRFYKIKLKHLAYFVRFIVYKALGYIRRNSLGLL